MSEIERLIEMLGCGNTMPQERIRWARSIVDIAHAEGVAEGEEQERERIRKAIAAADGAVIRFAHTDGTFLRRMDVLDILKPPIEVKS
jgi:hypothetical protein